MKKILCTCVLGLMLLLSGLIHGPAMAAEKNFNETAVGNASSSGISNANCNSALILFCNEVMNQVGVSPSSPKTQSSNGKVWGTGAEAFPGSETGLENTVSYMSGRTNAIFSSPQPDLGTPASLMFISLLFIGGLICRRKTGIAHHNLMNKGSI